MEKYLISVSYMILGVSFYMYFWWKILLWIYA